MTPKKKKVSAPKKVKTTSKKKVARKTVAKKKPVKKVISKKAETSKKLSISLVESKSTPAKTSNKDLKKKPVLELVKDELDIENENSLIEDEDELEVEEITTTASSFMTQDEPEAAGGDEDYEALKDEIEKTLGKSTKAEVEAPDEDEGDSFMDDFDDEGDLFGESKDYVSGFSSDESGRSDDFEKWRDDLGE